MISVDTCQHLTEGPQIHVLWDHVPKNLTNYIGGALKNRKRGRCNFVRFKFGCVHVHRFFQRDHYLSVDNVNIS